MTKLKLNQKIVTKWSQSLKEKATTIFNQSIKTVSLLEESIQNSSDIHLILHVARRVLKLRMVTLNRIHKLNVIEQKEKIKKHLIR